MTKSEKLIRFNHADLHVAGTPSFSSSGYITLLAVSRRRIRAILQRPRASSLPRDGWYRSDRFDYLIGSLIAEGDAVERHSFRLNDSNGQNQIFEQFLDTISRFDDFRVFSYGSYEKAFLRRMRMRSNRKDLVDRVLKSLVNTLSLIYRHIYFPTYSNGLKDVASYLGFR
jgi:predicted RecB family nuclease